MPKIEVDGLPVIDAPESEEITIAVSKDDMEAGDTNNPERHPVATRFDGGAAWMMPAYRSERY
jgi:hypothetical protein